MKKLHRYNDFINEQVVNESLLQRALSWMFAKYSEEEIKKVQNLIKQNKEALSALDDLKGEFDKLSDKEQEEFVNKIDELNPNNESLLGDLKEDLKDTWDSFSKLVKYSFAVFGTGMVTAILAFLAACLGIGGGLDGGLAMEISVGAIPLILLGGIGMAIFSEKQR